jgi:hypothetical protein
MAFQNGWLFARKTQWSMRISGLCRTFVGVCDNELGREIIKESQNWIGSVSASITFYSQPQRVGVESGLYMTGDFQELQNCKCKGECKEPTFAGSDVVGCWAMKRN